MTRSHGPPPPFGLFPRHVMVSVVHHTPGLHDGGAGGTEQNAEAVGMRLGVGSPLSGQQEDAREGQRCVRRTRGSTPCVPSEAARFEFLTPSRCSGSRGAAATSGLHRATAFLSQPPPPHALQTCRSREEANPRDVAQNLHAELHGCVFTLELAQLVVMPPPSLSLHALPPSLFLFASHQSVPGTAPGAEDKWFNKPQTLPPRCTGGPPSADM